MLLVDMTSRQNRWRAPAERKHEPNRTGKEVCCVMPTSSRTLEKSAVFGAEAPDGHDTCVSELCEARLQALLNLEGLCMLFITTPAISAGMI